MTNPKESKIDQLLADEGNIFMMDTLRPNISADPMSKKKLQEVAHWVEYYLSDAGVPVRKTDPNPYADRGLIGLLGPWSHPTMHKAFQTEFEAMVWIAGNDLDAKYLGKGKLQNLLMLVRR